MNAFAGVATARRAARAAKQPISKNICKLFEDEFYRAGECKTRASSQQRGDSMMGLGGASYLAIVSDHNAINAC